MDSVQLLLSTDSDSSASDIEEVVVEPLGWAVLREETIMAIHAFTIINEAYNRHPRATKDDDYYGGREYYDALSEKQRSLCRHQTQRKYDELHGFHKELYDALLSFDFTWWLNSGILPLEESKFAVFTNIVFQHPSLLQCQLFLKCYTPYFHHHLELRTEQHPGAPHEYRIWRRLRMLESLHRLQYYALKKHFRVPFMFLMCIEKAPYGQTYTIDFLKQYNFIASKIATYLVDTYVRTMY